MHSFMREETTTLQSQDHSSDQRHYKANGGAATNLAPSATVDAKNLSLSGEGNILLDRLVQALAVGNVQASKVIRHVEEHVAAVVQALEAFGVVREPVAAVGGGSVAQEDALDLVGEVMGELRIILHDVRVGCIGNKHELPLRESDKDLSEQVVADSQSSLDIGEVERSCVEGSAGVGLVDKVHVVASGLLRSGS
jgi:hypothetical protein